MNADDGRAIDRQAIDRRADENWADETWADETWFYPAPPPTSHRAPRLSVSSSNAFDPRYIVSAGSEWDGVGALVRDGSFDCTVSLLPSGRHILTAAHCFNSDRQTADLNPNPQNYQIRFDLPSGTVNLDAAQITVNPEWSSDFDLNNDLAIVELASYAPDAAQRYPIYRQSDEVGQVFTRVGYGDSGTGATGELPNDETRLKRVGQNRYDSLSDIFRTNSTSQVRQGFQLASDFDSGDPSNDALGADYGINDVGVGILEVGPSRGSSGGPGLINGQIAGVVSYGITPVTAGVDVSPGSDTSFGEIFSDTRVSAYAPWIDSTIALSNSGNDFIPGTSRNDTLNGNAGDDTIAGGAGDDSLFGGRDRDAISGEDGNDAIYGNLGRDAIAGNSGNDSLYGGQEDDTLIGGIGDDLLSGDRGQDLLTGEAGSDRFVLGITSGDADPNRADVLTDFEIGVDQLVLTDGLTPAAVSLQPYTLGITSGTVAIANGVAIGFFSNHTAAALTGSLTSAIIS